MIIDYLGNTKGEIAKVEPVMFLFGESKRVLFAHTFRDYLLSAGFRELTLIEEPDLPGEHPGWGLIRAKK